MRKGLYDERKVKDELQCMEQVTALTLEMVWFDVYTTIPAYLRRTEAAVEAIGGYMMKCEDYLLALQSLQDLLRGTADIKAQIQALKGVEREYLRSIPMTFCCRRFMPRLERF